MRKQVAAIAAIAVACAVGPFPREARAASVLAVPGDYATIQAAIDAAGPADTIEVAPGVYHERIILDGSKTLESSGGASVTTIDGDAGGSVIRITSGFANPTIRGFTITDGAAFCGGGISLEGTGYTGDALIEHNVITGNTSTFAGGGVCMSWAAATVLQHNEITHNTPADGVGNGGGGVYIAGGGVPSVSDNLIADNLSGNYAGGMEVGANATLDRNVIRDNTGQTAGGIHLSGDYFGAVTNNVVIGNSWTNRYVGLDAATFAGGISSANRGTYIGIYVSGNTLAGNMAPSLATSGVAPVGFRDNILLQAAASVGVSCAGTEVPDMAHNDVVNGGGAAYGGACAGAAGSGDVSVDPMFVDAAGGDYHLRAGSPLIDAGSNEFAPATDMDGEARPFDGDFDGNAFSDIGADERVDTVQVSPLRLDAGGVYLASASRVLTATVTNRGAASLSMTAASIAGADAAEASVTADTCSGGTVAPGASCAVAVVVSPTALGPRTASLVITGAAPVGTRTVEITASGLDPVAITPSAVDFGSVVIGTTSATKSVVVHNAGPVDLDVTAVGLRGSSPAAFSILGETCTGAPVSPGGSCQVSLAGKPPTAGAAAASLVISVIAPVGDRYVALTETGSPPPTAPGAPTSASAVAADRSAVISWVAPGDNGGSSITGYTVTSSPDAKTCSTAGALSCIVTGLLNGTAYTFTVRAANVAGTGPASGASNSVTPRTVPGAPTGVTASPGAASAVVRWSAPASNGGSAITGYTVTSSPTARSCSTTGALSCTVTGLADGLYTFSVRASNVAGAGPASAVSPQVRIDTTRPTVTAPAVSLNVNTTIGTSASVRLTWSGADGGSGIDHYQVLLQTNSGAYVAVASPTTAGYSRWLAISPTTTYRYAVRAFDKAGNVSAYAYTPAFHVRLTQQSSAAVRYYGTWYSGYTSYASGGSYRYTSVAGRYASYTFSGRTIAVVAYRGAALGSFKVYVDGVYKATVSDYASSTQWRRIVYSLNVSQGTHVVRIVCSGTPGRPRMDLDAFVVLG